LVGVVVEVAGEGWVCAVRACSSLDKTEERSAQGVIKLKIIHTDSTYILYGSSYLLKDAGIV
jgi:hypothetical protein